MANQGMCDKNDIVFDPFAGTGSMLLSAAKFGSYVIGCDIDFLMLHGKTKPSRISQKVRALDESIVANMQQYGLEHLYLDVFVSDFSNCPFTDAIVFDSIVTDRKSFISFNINLYLFNLFNISNGGFVDLWDNLSIVITNQ